MKMAEQNKPSGEKVNSGNDKIACHLVSLPTIVLTRIDINSLKSVKTKNSTIKKMSKNVTVKKKKLASPVKSPVKKITSNKIDNRTRGRPRKEAISGPKSQKPSKKSVKAESTLKTNKTANKPKLVSKPQISAAKNILKKTMLQKKIKVVIPEVKKPKLVKKQTIKKTPQKLIKPVAIDKKSEMHIKKPADTDTSEDEFLYDELIDEFENTISKESKTANEKTTNITLKPSLGNKPPTIVKGGIIKINNLPADLKTIASPGQQLPKNKISESHSQKRPKLSNIDCPVPPKKASPWPISISSPSKAYNNASPNKNKKSPISVNKSLNSSTKLKSVAKPQRKPGKGTDYSLASINGSDDSLVVETKSISPMPGKRKIGPKVASKIGPAFHSVSEDDNLSDEYTEVETLENIDYEVDGTFSNQEPVNTTQLKSNTSETPTLTPLDTLKDDEDPNLDLLRILTDESDDCPQMQTETPTGNINEINLSSGNDKIDNLISNEVIENQIINGNSPSKESLVIQQSDEEPKVRTIYDLINEISLQRPSWNLHIIPETNAFCIAQVTKGRLGLPTLKKCIELDPVDYNAKVYIHQYHIKRFDGVYDSEESILALIEDIDSIKA